jgi:hypothetical protein
MDELKELLQKINAPKKNDCHLRLISLIDNQTVIRICRPPLEKELH